MAAPTKQPTTPHTTDSDCTLDSTDICRGCGVYHGDPCQDCGGRGFHAESCAALIAEVA